MYYFMNKDQMVLTFRAKPGIRLEGDVSFEEIDRPGRVPYGFTSIAAWIDSRKASKHNIHLRKVMQQLGCESSEGFIRLTHALGINDTFWIKSDVEDVTWKDVSLYDNPFTETISRLAFEGAGLYGEVFSSTSPELSCDGTFRKCFRKEGFTGEYGSNIFLYKRGHELGKGLEPYCEVLASEVAKIVAPLPASVRYDLCSLHGKLASRCNIFTSESVGYAAYSKLLKANTYSLDDAWKFFESIESEQSFREMLVVDALCFNQDRHSGNFGVLVDNETQDILGMAPVFDLNIAMLPYVEMNEFDKIGDKLFNYAPKLGNDFTRIGQIAMNDIIRDRLKDIADFSFSFRGDDVFTEARIRCLENILHRQAAAILSKDKLHTADVFFSQEAVYAEDKRKKSEKASLRMNNFYKVIEEMKLSPESFISSCDDEDMVQIYIENGSYELALDFIKKSAMIRFNAREVSLQTVNENAENFYRDIQLIREKLEEFIVKEAIEGFDFAAMSCVEPEMPRTKVSW